MTSRGAVPQATRRLALGMVAVVACVALAACGSSSDSSSDTSSSSSATTSGGGSGTVNVAEAQKRLTAAEQPPVFKAPGPAFDGSKAKGKKVMYIGVDQSIPIVKTVLDSATDAASKLGMTITAFDGKGQVSEFNRGIETAVSQNYDAIVLLAIPSDAVKAAIADAEKAGVKVIEAQEHDPNGPSAPGVTATVSFCYSCAGKSMADYVVANSGGKAQQGTVFVSKDVSNGDDELSGIQAEFKELCPDCTFDVQNVPIADWQTRLPTLTRSILTSKPDTGWLLPLYDGMTIPMIPAVVQAGKQDSVKISTFNATPSVMKEMSKGNVVAADVGGANVWFGWGLADQLARVLSGEKPVETENIPNRAFNSTNLDTIDLNANESTWYGDADYQGEYMKLWGLGS